MTQKEARRYGQIIARAKMELIKTTNDMDLIYDLCEVIEALHAASNTIGHPYGIYNSTNPDITVGELYDMRSVEGEEAMLKATGMSRATFFRRLKRVKQYATDNGIDANTVRFFTDCVK